MEKRTKGENVFLFIIFTILILGLIITISYEEQQIQKKNDIINELQAQIVSLQEENRDVMNLYTEMIESGK